MTMTEGFEIKLVVIVNIIIILSLGCIAITDPIEKLASQTRTRRPDLASISTAIHLNRSTHVTPWLPSFLWPQSCKW